MRSLQPRLHSKQFPVSEDRPLAHSLIFLLRLWFYLGEDHLEFEMLLLYPAEQLGL